MDPLIISALISAALSAYSTQQQASARNKVQDQQAVAAQAERARQAAIDNERMATVAKSREEFTPEKQNEDQTSIAKNLEQYLAPENARTAAEAQYADAANPGAPKEVADSRERALASGIAKGASYAKNLAQMSALKNLNFGNALQLNRLGTNVGELNTQASRSAALLPYELDVAGHAGDANLTRSSAAQGLASIAAMYGASQYGKPAAVPTAAPQGSASLKAVDMFGNPLDPTSLGSRSDFSLRQI